MILDPNEVIWIVAFAFVVAFFLAFGVGANDVANSFGTSVGSKVLTLKQACIMATVFEISGACLLGYKVSDTVRKGIFDIAIYEDDEKTLMLGNLAALCGSASWNIIATAFRLPVSGTHSIVGAMVGFSLVARGFSGINFRGLVKIVASWFVSPVLSGLLSAAIFYCLRRFILFRKDALERGLIMLPFIYGATLMVNVFSLILDGPPLLRFDLIPVWGAGLISTTIASLVGAAVWKWYVPGLRREILPDEEQAKPLNPPESASQDAHAKGVEDAKKDAAKDAVSNGEIKTISKSASAASSAAMSPPATNVKAELLLQPPKAHIPRSMHSMEKVVFHDLPEEEKPEVARLFSFLQILTAVFGSFAHGGNDVANAVGPLIAVWLIYKDGTVQQVAPTPFWVLLYGGIGISAGLWLWGKKVIQTIGNDLTKVTPTNGFSIEIGAASTVLLASKLGIPISTTHCKVGSIVFVGCTRNQQNVDWILFRGIVAAWLLTLPITMALTAVIMAILMQVG
ncbi:sodium-dependent phosphate transporter 1-A-like [Tropilaelaps mercedesae]|uniref:Phosphate transporter n=1 Tax=Tropilaelaps mercedesae TaxID=418985 RepID=A0A1V9XH20_9ACAR|nr:sodium-dependent phosphate transporter 1-A-like [Tropilaelaps mercedesae]